MTEQETYNFSFRCYFPSDDGVRYSTHYQRLALSDLPRWLDAYRFTHPNCLSISSKIWFTEQEASEDCD